MLNNDLSPNLTTDEPSQYFLIKGGDEAVAALQSELGLLFIPVACNAQTVETGN